MPTRTRQRYRAAVTPGQWAADNLTVEQPLLIASDVDGTLLDAFERLAERTRAVVNRATAAGVPVVLASGRPPRWIPAVAKAAGLTGYAVCANGAVLYDIGADRVVEVHGLLQPELLV